MSVTPFGNKDYFFNVGASIVDSIADSLQCNGLSVPERLFVGFDSPPQDCCPELVGWIGNVRPWDLDFPESRQSGRLLCANAYAFDVSIRIGRCYVDSADGGQPINHATLQDWGQELYHDLTAIYVGWINQWRGGQVEELNDYELVTVGNCTQYHSGGCAGHEFTITVGTFG